MPESVSLEIGGRTLIIETGELAKQANGSALVRYGDANVVLAAVTASENPREGLDFFPLTCEFEERMYAAGKIPGGYIKREGRPSEHGTLSARQIDRPIRPLFPEGFRNDVQIVTTVLSIDRELDADVLAVCGAGAALAVSDLPFQATVAAVRVGLKTASSSQSTTQYETGGLDIVVAGTPRVMMVEGGGHGFRGRLSVVEFGHNEVTASARRSISSQRPARPSAPTRSSRPTRRSQRGCKKQRVAKARVNEKAERNAGSQLSRDAAIEKLGAKDTAVRAILEDDKKAKDFDKIIKAMEEEELRVMVVDEKIRPDGRKADEIRPIWTKVGILPRVHGTGVFTRGQTQVLTAATLGSMGDEQRLDGIMAIPNKRYMHYYNFPPYSVGETRPMRGPGRREIGHGHLAERALVPVLPDQEDFPYTLRVISETLESTAARRWHRSAAPRSR